MHNFIKAFVREGPPRVQVTPGMRFTAGTTFMGVDVVKLLEAQAILR